MILIPVKYHNKNYPDGVFPQIDEIAGNFDSKAINMEKPYSLHTEYSYMKRDFDSELLDGLDELKNANKNGIPQLWKSIKWSEEYALFIERLIGSSIPPEVIEIHPPFKDYCDNITVFWDRYIAFYKHIISKFSTTKIIIENRCGTMYTGSEFLISTCKDVIKLCQFLVDKHNELGIIIDYPQLFSAEKIRMDNVNIEKILQFNLQLKPCLLSLQAPARRRSIYANFSLVKNSSLIIGETRKTKSLRCRRKLVMFTLLRAVPRRMPAVPPMVTFRAKPCFYSAFPLYFIHIPNKSSVWSAFSLLFCEYNSQSCYGCHTSNGGNAFNAGVGIALIIRRSAGISGDVRGGFGRAVRGCRHAHGNAFDRNIIAADSHAVLSKLINIKCGKRIRNAAVNRNYGKTVVLISEFRVGLIAYRLSGTFQRRPCVRTARDLDKMIVILIVDSILKCDNIAFLYIGERFRRDQFAAPASAKIFFSAQQIIRRKSIDSQSTDSYSKRIK